jgi:hypothetical protein
LHQSLHVLLKDLTSASYKWTAYVEDSLLVDACTHESGQTLLANRMLTIIHTEHIAITSYQAWQGKSNTFLFKTDLARESHLSEVEAANWT